MFSVTPNAAEELLAAAERSDAAGMALRIAARMGADGEVEVGMGFDEEREEDQSAQFGELTVLLGAPSQRLLADTVLDWVEVAPGEFGFVFLPSSPASGCGSAPARGGCGSGGCGSCGG